MNIIFERLMIELNQILAHHETIIISEVIIKHCYV